MVPPETMPVMIVHGEGRALAVAAERLLCANVGLQGTIHH